MLPSKVDYLLQTVICHAFHTMHVYSGTCTMEAALCELFVLHTLNWKVQSVCQIVVWRVVTKFRSKVRDT